MMDYFSVAVGWIAGAVMTGAWFMWMGRDTRCTHEDEDAHSNVDDSGRMR